MVTGKEIIDCINANNLSNKRIHIDPNACVAYIIHRDHHAGLASDSFYRHEELTKLLKKANLESNHF